MSDSEGTGKQVVHSGDANQLEMFAEMAAIERERIQSRNRMTEAMTAGLDHMNAADKRQSEIRKDEIERDDNYRNRRLTYTVRFAAVGLALVAVVVGLFAYMVFWGTPEQRQAAFTSVSVVGALGTGFLGGRLSRGR